MLQLTFYYQHVNCLLSISYKLPIDKGCRYGIIFNEVIEMSKASKATTRIKFLSNNINTLYKVLAELHDHKTPTVKEVTAHIRQVLDSLEGEYTNIIQNINLPDESL